MSVDRQDQVEFTLKMQLIVSTVILIFVLLLASYISYPAAFEMRLAEFTIKDLTIFTPWFCALIGLIAGMIIAAFT
jgi:Na+/H+-translocating membrane pyrophosphatase